MPFLVYALIRLFGNFALFGQITGWFKSEVGALIIKKITEGMDKLNPQAFIKVSPGIYLAYVAVVGITMAVGTIGILLKQNWGFYFMTAYCLLFIVGIVNFKAFNIKVVIFAFYVVALIILYFLRSKTRA
ncbi:MAG: hypothetical protein COA43_15085 [Robiginitomaculum sp.]|nr:MAG: hypothetical protein COA43_15085 [Robiginitomaculum sp.]